MAETGLSLVVSKEMLANLQKADNAITNLATKSEQAKNRIVAAFTEMGQKGVGAFINQLNEAQNKLASLGNVKIGSANFNAFSQSVVGAIDVINKLTSATNKIPKDNIISLKLDDKKGGDSFDNILTKYKQRIDQLKKEMDIFKSWESGNLLNTKDYAYIGKVADEVNRLISAYYALDRAQQTLKRNDFKSYIQGLGGNTLEEQESKRTLALMREYYIEEEKRIQENVKQQAKAENEKRKELAKSAKEAERIAKQQAKAEEQRIKQESRMRKKDYERYVSTQDTYSHAMNVSNRAKTLNQEIRAIKALEQARGNLNKTDSQYEAKLLKLNAAIRQHKQNIERATLSAKSLQNSHRGLLNISEQLTRRLALVFSVSQITGYISKLISVRGEFELQQRSLQAILQNRDEANKLWQQTIDLAVRSPFRVKELVTYTKQLAAYRIETDKLHETTKMLSDVSAGLGVDMQRLILAFGQVKAANYLRGTELRQFSEAGINILGELSNYFTELEGNAVSVGEVFERVSKRMVTFGDVEEVFKRLTSAGGTFYRMQEIQSNTLRGMISNLKDSIDLMLNDIGESSDSVLKRMVGVTKTLVENWETLANMLKIIVAGFAMYKVNAFLTGDAIKLLAIDMRVINDTIPKQLSLIQLLQVGWRKLSLSIKSAGVALKEFAASNVIILALTALALAIKEVVTWNDELNEQLDKLNTKRDEELSQINNLVRAYQKLNKEQQKEGANSNAIFEEKLKKLRELQNLMGSAKFSIAIATQPITQENIDDIFSQTEELLRFAQSWGYDLGLEIAKGMSGAEGWFHIFGDNLLSDLKDLDEANTQITGSMTYGLEKVVKAVQASYPKLTKEAQRYVDALDKGRRKDESEEDWLERKVRLLQGIYKLYDISKPQELVDVEQQLLHIASQRKEVAGELDKVVDRMLKSYGVTDFSHLTSEQKVLLKTEIDKAFEQQQLSEQTKRFAAYYMANKLKIPVEFITPNETGQGLQDWQTRYNAFIEGLTTKSLSAIRDVMQTREALRKTIKEQVEQQQDIIDSYNVKGQEAYSIAEMKEAEKKVKDLTKAYLWLGGSLDDLKKKGISRDKTWDDLMRVVKEVNTEFKNLNKTFDKTTSLQGVLAKYSDALTTAFKGTGKVFTDFDFTTESGLVAFYDWLISVIPQVDKLKAELAKGEVVWGLKISDKTKDDKALLDQIEEMFSGYELSIELQKLNIPNDLAKQLFDVDAITLPELKLQVESLKSQFEGKDMLDEWDKLMKRINEMEAKAQQERLKTYSQYLIKAQSERVKIKLEELRKIAEVEKESAFTDTQRQEILEALRKETQKNLDKLTWDEFKDSDLYLKVFEDLEYVSDVALTSVKDKLDLMRSSLNNLSVEDLRIITKEMQKIDEELIQRSPFKALTSNLKDYILFLKERNEIEQKWIDSQSKEDALKAQTDDSQIRIAQLQQEYETSVKTKGVLNEESIAIKRKLDFEKQILDNNLKQLVAQGKITQEYADQLREGEQNKKGVVEGLKGAMNDINDGYNAFNGLMDTIQSMFGEFGEGFQSFLDGVSGVVDGLGTIEGGLSQILDGKIFSGIINTITGVFKSIGAIFGIGLGDIRKQREIEREIVLVEDLQKQYEKLNKTINKAYSISSLEINQKAMSKNIDTQIRSYEKMIKLEDDKKNTDKEKIKEWEDTIEELREKRKELNDEILSGLGGVTEQEYRSATRAFVDAWTSAFQETGNGLEGLQQHFADFFNNILSEQATLHIAQNMLAPFYRQVESALNDSRLSSNEAKALKDKFTEIAPQINDFLSTFFENIGGFVDGSKYELSGLQRGIQGITEDQADVIASYLNSMRFFVADSNTKLSLLVDSFTNPESANPMLSELRSQSEMIRAIRDMFSSVIGRGSSTHTGAFLKVAL